MQTHGKSRIDKVQQVQEGVKPNVQMRGGKKYKKNKKFKKTATSLYFLLVYITIPSTIASTQKELIKGVLFTKEVLFIKKVLLDP